MNDVRPTLYVLAGPTASGKTEAALTWAKTYGGEILSADSTLFYRGMNIGTAKPTAEELACVPHHGIDLISVRETFSIKTYVELAQQVVADVTARGKPLLITGGSGFYLKAFFAPVVDSIEVPHQIAEQVQALQASQGLPGLLSCLREYSPEGFGQLDIHNPRRVQRALERVLTTGKSIVQLEAQWAAQKSPFADYPKYVWLIERSSEDLQARITARTDLMIQQGLLDEVKHLMAEGLESNPIAASTIGYRECIAYFRGELSSLAALKVTLIRNTLQLVKKQRTFFRHQIPVNCNISLQKDMLQPFLCTDVQCNE